MARPYFVTFTGLEARTNLAHAERLSVQYPLEWGVLISASRQGQDPTYPTFGWINEALSARRLRLAGHVCGAMARAIWNSEPHEGFDKINWRLFNRIQINVGDGTDPSRLMAVWRWGLRYAPFAHLILQAPDDFPSTHSLTLNHSSRPPIHWLLDASGGNGIVRRWWSLPKNDYVPVGYAGGLGPDTLGDFFAAINPVYPAHVPFWIDMQGRVADANGLNTELCTQVCRLVYPDL